MKSLIKVIELILEGLVVLGVTGIIAIICIALGCKDITIGVWSGITTCYMLHHFEINLTK